MICLIFLRSSNEISRMVRGGGCVSHLTFLNSPPLPLSFGEKIFYLIKSATINRNKWLTHFLLYFFYRIQDLKSVLLGYIIYTEYISSVLCILLVLMCIDKDLLIYCKIHCFRSFHWICLVYLKKNGRRFIQLQRERLFIFTPLCL